MRNFDSTFSAFCRFINNKPVGSVYRTSEMISEVASTERTTSWKRNTRTTASARYQTMLKYSGILKWEGRGRWKIVQHIPDWFTSAHLYTAAGHGDVYRKFSNGEWKYVPRTNMNRDEIKAKLREFAEIQKGAQRIADNSTYGAIHTVNGKAVEDPREVLDNMMGNPLHAIDNMIYSLAGATPFPSLTAKAEPIKKEDSTFFKNPDAGKYNQQLQENLMLNAGYINSALAILDQADFLDSVQHARVLNIMAQLKDLQRTIEERVEYKRTKPNTNF